MEKVNDKRSVMIEIEERDLLDLIHWARRYCDGRMTYAPSSFNKIYQRLIQRGADKAVNKTDDECFGIMQVQEKSSGTAKLVGDQFDKTLMRDGDYFPYAQDGMYNPDTGAFDAIR